MAAAVAAGEQVVLAAERDRADRAFDRCVVLPSGTIFGCTSSTRPMLL
jgi:hypothetical protein